jgi:O-antigen/teichoic acid export membrane protein
MLLRSLNYQYSQIYGVATQLVLLGQCSQGETPQTASPTLNPREDIMSVISSVGKNILSLTFGTGLAQGLGVASTLIIARLYSTDAYSDFGIFSSWLIVLNIAVCGCLHLALATRTDPEEANQVRLGAYIMGFAVTLLTTPVLFLFPQAYWPLKYLPLALLSSVLFQVEYGSAWRIKSFNRMSFSKVLQVIVTVAIQLVLGFFNAKAEDLMWGAILGPLVSGFYLLRTNPSMPRVSFLSIKGGVRKHLKYPLISMPSYVVDMMGKMLPGFLFPLMGWTNEVGFLFLAMKTLMLPISLISQSVGQVVFQRLSTSPKNEARKLIRKVTLRLFLISIPSVLMVFFFGPELYKIVFGSKWALSGVYATWLCLWLGATFIAQPFHGIFDFFQKQKVVFIVNLVILMAQILLIVVGKELELGVENAVIGYSLAGALGQFIILGLGFYWFARNVSQKGATE